MPNPPTALATPEPWGPPPATLTLANGTLHLWQAALTSTPELLATLTSLLTPDERTRADRFVFALHRERYIIARAAFRCILAAYLHVAPTDLRFSYGPFGKPALAPPHNDPRLHFNLAHSGDLALYALTYDHPVGVDLEAMRTDLAYRPLLSTVCTPSEQTIIAGLPEASARYTFYRAWVAKEAYLKARGEGLHHPLTSVSLSLAPGAPPTLQPASADPPASWPWVLYPIDVGPAYLAAAVSAGPCPRVCHFTHRFAARAGQLSLE